MNHSNRRRGLCHTTSLTSLESDVCRFCQAIVDGIETNYTLDDWLINRNFLTMRNPELGEIKRF